MRTLTLRIYLTVVVVLLLFASVSGWLFQQQLDRERALSASMLSERTEAWADLLQRSLPGSQSPAPDQAAAVRAWSERLKVPLALHDVQGQRIVASESYLRREGGHGAAGFPVRLDDGRTLWVLRGGTRREGQGPAWAGSDHPLLQGVALLAPAGSGGIGVLALFALLFVAVAAAAWPVARVLTQRLKALQHGMERFGAGQLDHRVAVAGLDEVAAVASSFNHAASRIETLVRSHQSLLANASHELRSPLARLKMAVTMLEQADDGAQRSRLRQEIGANIAELDGLVEEVLLASRLDAIELDLRLDSVDLLGLAAEEAARVGASVQGAPGAPGVAVQGDEKLLRRALRNLLENACRYGGSEIAVEAVRHGECVTLSVCDRGPGVPPEQRQRIFEPFYRMPGHAEKAGGVGLGLSLVRQIAERHRGTVVCEPRPGGGSCFKLSLPAPEATPAL